MAIAGAWIQYAKQCAIGERRLLFYHFIALDYDASFFLPEVAIAKALNDPEDDNGSLSSAVCYLQPIFSLIT